VSEFVTVTFKTAALRRKLFILRAEFVALAASIPERGAQAAVTAARASTSWNDRSHKTRESIKSRQIGPYRWRFSAGGASLWLDKGTGIYGPKGSPIVPTHAKFLRFKIGAQTFFRRSVKGQKATHFVDKARDEAESYVVTRVAHDLHAIIDAFNK
jgi:hypothetical protein